MFVLNVSVFSFKFLFEPDLLCVCVILRDNTRVAAALGPVQTVMKKLIHLLIREMLAISV